MEQTITLSEKQSSILNSIVTSGKVDISTGFDKRTINSLEKRGLVKVTQNSKGTFATATAKGKKLS